MRNFNENQSNTSSIRELTSSELNLVSGAGTYYSPIKSAQQPSAASASLIPKGNTPDFKFELKISW